MITASAFPYVAKYCIGHDNNGAPVYSEDTFPGMTLRDYFAGQALQGFTADTGFHYPADELSHRCYKLADAMMLAREQK